MEREVNGLRARIAELEAERDELTSKIEGLVDQQFIENIKREGAATWLEERAVEVNYLTSCDMKLEAARLRKGEVMDEVFENEITDSMCDPDREFDKTGVSWSVFHRIERDLSVVRAELATVKAERNAAIARAEKADHNYQETVDYLKSCIADRDALAASNAELREALEKLSAEVGFGPIDALRAARKASNGNV